MTIVAFCKKWLRPVLLTAVLVAIATYCFHYLWQTYLVAPWTRDGRLRAEIAEIAPQVSGNIVRIAVPDNGFVKEGDIILEIDPDNYRIAVARSEAELAEAKFREQQLRDTAHRFEGIPTHLVSAEEVTNAKLSWRAQQQAVTTAEAVLELAQLNLANTQVRAPFDGYVANMDLCVGSWLNAGQPILAFVNKDHFFAVGYFQENRLQGVCPGASASITFLGKETVYPGTVTSVGRGIADTNQNISSQLLADVGQTFPWIRLAQRIPVRVAFDKLPPQSELIAGRTVSVVVHNDRPCP